MNRLLARAASASPAGGLLKPGRVNAGRLTRAVLLTRSQPGLREIGRGSSGIRFSSVPSLAPLRVPASFMRESVRRQLSSGSTAARLPECGRAPREPVETQTARIHQPWATAR